jgi:molybdopterin-guanine dinucleotide biosynthesis protein MobB
MVELKDAPEKKLEDLIGEIDRPDIVIVEGYKNDNHPKIEIINNPLKPSTFMFTKLSNVVALICDTRIVEYSQLQFKKNEIKKIVQFILNYK